MSISRLPMAAETLLRAMMSGSTEGALAAFHPSASVDVRGKACSGPGLRSWIEAFVAEAPLDVRVMSRSGGHEETVLTVLIYRVGRIEGPVTWSMRTSDNRIEWLSIAEVQGPDMPPVVKRFFDALNRGNLPALMQCFAADALVNDELIEYLGERQIQTWGEQHVVGQKLALHPVKCIPTLERAIITAHVTGEFDLRGLPDPLVASLYFSLVGDKVSQLVILQNVGQGALG